MSVFRVHFTWKNKEYSLKATSLDMTHPYFVSIKDLLLPEGSLLINPADDEIRKNFGGVRQLLLPFSAVSLIEEYRRDPDGDLLEKKPAKPVSAVQGRAEILTPEKFSRKD